VGVATNPLNCRICTRSFLFAVDRFVQKKLQGMEKYILTDDLRVFGVQVESFPNGIGEAFDSLIKMLPGRFNRSFYGISYMKDGAMVYIAAAEEKDKGEAQKYHCERYIVEKGEYLTETIRDWRKKTDHIGEVFHEMMRDPHVDKTKPCIEWYKNDDEMFCMVRSK